ncbi:MAG: hypothetical protein HZA84_05805 [Thaumarchaeota archaeon]|nr:hypothetical protein [Nitrososphaerota archaeon]
MTLRYLILISVIAAVMFCGSSAYVFADTTPIAKQDYVGKHIIYKLDSSASVKNKLVQSVSGQIKYNIVSFDSKSGEFTLTRSVDLKSKDGTKFTTTQDIRSRLSDPLSLFDIVSYVDPIFPGKTEFTLKQAKESKSYDIGIVRRDLLEQQTVLNKSIEPTLVHTLEGSVKTFDQTMIPSSISLDLKSVSLDGAKDKAVYDAVLEDYGPLYDYYKNMKFSLKITATYSDFKNGKTDVYEPTTPKQKTPSQTPKYLVYENKQYGFSIKYPSNWKMQETLQKDPNSNYVSIVGFTPSQNTIYGIGFSANNQDYKGLNEKQFLDKMKKQISNACSAGASSGVTCSEITTATDTHKNGYVLYGAYYSASVPSEQGTTILIEMTAYIPDGNDMWSLQIVSASPTELEQISKDVGASLDTFTIYDYEGVKASKTVKTQPPVITSSVGTLQLNSGEFFVSKYAETDAIVSGRVSNYQQGIPLTLKITMPDNAIEEQNARVTKDGNFKMPLKIGSDWPAGTYTITARYGSLELGSVSFQITVAKAK